MFESTRRSFGGAALLGQYDRCQPFRDNMASYARKIGEFNRQMKEALAKGDARAADLAQKIALDAANKWEEQRKLLEACLRRGGYSPFRPAPPPIAPLQPIFGPPAAPPPVPGGTYSPYRPAPGVPFMPIGPLGPSIPAFSGFVR